MAFFTTLAMALDTLPSEGRVLLLALLLTGALFGFSRLLPDEIGSSVNVLYRKGALLALVLVPALVYLLNIKVSVPVEEVTRFDTAIPGYAALALLWVWAAGCLWHLYRFARDLRATHAAASAGEAVSGQIEARARHWQNRLNLKGDVRILCVGAEQGWHVSHLFLASRRPAIVILPAAALNWPAGVVDALLLQQLAQLHQGSWRWLAFGRCVQALYWPAPWIAKLVQQLAGHLEQPGLRLAAAAYRDPEGWQRDLRNLRKRASTLGAVELPEPGGLLRLPNSGAAELDRAADARGQGVEDDSFEAKWSGTKRRRRAKQRDPYEQAYWLIAVASIVVGIASTLTLVKAPPEFDPQYLNVKWQDRMVRRLRDFHDEPAASEDAEEPPRKK